MTKIVECTKCNQFPELTDEQISALSELLFATNMKIANMITMLNTLGKCPKDNQNHTVKINVEYLVSSTEYANKTKIVKDNLDQLQKLQADTKQKYEDLQTEIKKTEEQLNITTEKISNTSKNLSEYQQEFETISKTKHIELWT